MICIYIHAICGCNLCINNININLTQQDNKVQNIVIKMHNSSLIPNLMKNYQIREELQSGKDLLIRECLKIRRPQSVNATMLHKMNESKKYSKNRHIQINKESIQNQHKSKNNIDDSEAKNVKSKINKNIYGSYYKFSKQQQQKGNQKYKPEKIKRYQHKSKSPCKQRHPIIRSFIIKDVNQQLLTHLDFSCDNEHKLLQYSLNQCINKTKLNSSNEFAELNRQKNGRKISQSFNNIKVKQILESQSKQQQPDKRNTQRMIKSSYNQRRIHKNDQNTKTNKTLNCESPEIVDIFQHKTADNYSHITEYPISICENKKEIKPENVHAEKKLKHGDILHKDSFVNQNFTAKGNYNGYLWQVKQKKLKKFHKSRGSPDINVKASSNHDFLNVKMLNFLKSSVQGNNNNKLKEKQQKNTTKSSKIQKNQTFKSFSPLKYNVQNCQNCQKNVQLSQFMIFTDIQKHTPRKRKISLNTPSPQKKKDSNQQDPHYFFSNKRIQKIFQTPQQENNFCVAQESEQGNSCYLRTLNFS